MTYSNEVLLEIKKGRSKFIAMAITYSMGVFNDNFFKMAAMLLALAVGKSQLQGVATVLFSLPFVLFAAHAGWIADRFPKKNVVIAAKALEFLAMIVGAIGIITLNWFLILGMVTIMGLQSTLFGPALNGSIPELYPEVYVPKANALIKLVTTLSILIGMALAGICLDWTWGEAKVSIGKELVAGMVLLMALIGFVASFKAGKSTVKPTHKKFPFAGPWHSVKDFISVKKDQELFIALVGHFIFYAVSSLAILLINTLGVNQFGYSNTIASLLSVALMIGICFGSFLSVKLTAGKRWDILIVPSMAGIGLGLFLAALALFIPDNIRLLYLIITLGFAGTSGGMLLIPVTSFIQTKPLEHEKGKVIGVSYFIDFIGIMVSGQVFTLLNYLFKPSTGILIVGLSLIGVTLLFKFYLGTDDDTNVKDRLQTQGGVQ